jgi:predicted MFS family arabinose efflux permease
MLAPVHKSRLLASASPLSGQPSQPGRIACAVQYGERLENMIHAELAFRRPRRWATLGAYSLIVGVSQMLWLNFAPLLTLVQHRYGVSELVASLLVLVFPLLYVVFSIPAGALTDARGYRFTAGLGALVMTASAFVRIFEGSFWPLLVGQIGIAVAQPYIVNAVSKLVADWFSPAQGAIATGLATMGMFIGMAAGMAVTPALVADFGLRAAMVVFASVTLASSIAFAIAVHPNDMAPPEPSAQLGAASGFGPLLRNRHLRLLFALSLLGLGVFNGLTTWLEQILAPRGIDAEQAGLIGGAILVGGIGGSVLIPALSDVTKRRKPFLLGCVALALITLYPLCTGDRYSLLLLTGALHGFFFLPSFALLLEMCSQIAGARSAGAATSLLMLTGNAGGVLVVLAMPLVKGQGTDFRASILLMTALLGLTLLLAFRAPETFAYSTSEAPAA